MSTMDESTQRLKLRTGIEVQAFVSTSEGRARPKFLLLHGNPGSIADWKQLVPRLSSVADIAAIDMPGFGQSSRGDAAAEALGLEKMAAHAVAVADALSWREPFYLVGHSHGGGVAQVAAAKYPERIAGLVLIGTLGAPAHLSYRLLALPGAEVTARV